MKKILLIALLCCVSSSAFAKITIIDGKAIDLAGFAGKITTTDGAPVPNVLINITAAESENTFFSPGEYEKMYDGGGYAFAIDCGDEKYERQEKLFLFFQHVAKKDYFYAFSPKDLCMQTEPEILNVVLEHDISEMEEVIATGDRIIVSGCRVEGTYEYETIRPNWGRWEQFKTAYGIPGGNSEMNVDSKIIKVKSTDITHAEELLENLENVAGDFGFSNLKIEDCVNGSASDLTGLYLRPRYQAGIGKLSGDAKDITGWLQRFGKKIAGAMAAIAVFFVVWNAFNIIIARGDADDISKAKKALTWVVFGLLVTIFAYVIVKTVISLTYLW